MTDWLLAALALAVLCAFLAVILAFVPEVDLTLVTLVVVLMVVYDFASQLLRRR